MLLALLSGGAVAELVKSFGRCIIRWGPKVLTTFATISRP